MYVCCVWVSDGDSKPARPKRSWASKQQATSFESKNNERRARSALPTDCTCTKGPGVTNAPRPRFRATFSWTCPCNLHRRKHPRRPTLPKGLAPCPTSNAGRAAALRSCSSAPPPYLRGSQASESSNTRRKLGEGVSQCHTAKREMCSFMRVSGGSVHNRKNVFSKRFIPIGTYSGFAEGAWE